MRGCVGAIDGWLCPIQVPRRREVRIVASFFSGHYPRYGINVRPRVDYHCRFTAISSSSPGGMGDYIAYLHWKLSQLADTFPKGLHLVGDNAYSNSNTLLTPLRRPHTTIASRDSSNFLLSQLRIRVEMAFGLLVNKWRIFKSPLRVGMKHMGKVIHVACILHHWCINERLGQDGGADIELDEDLSAAVAKVGASSSGTGVEDAIPAVCGDMTVSARDVAAFCRYDSTQLDAKRRTESELLRNGIAARLGNTVRPDDNVRRAALDRELRM